MKLSFRKLERDFGKNEKVFLKHLLILDSESRMFNEEEPTITEYSSEYEMLKASVSNMEALEEMTIPPYIVKRKSLNPSEFSYINVLNEAFHTEDASDIIEDPVITEEAEESIHFLFEKIQNKEDKLRITVEENGGAAVIFKNWKLVIYPTGKRFALKNFAIDGNVRFFKEEEKETLLQIINKIMGVIVPEEDKYDAKRDLAAPITIKLKKGFDRAGLRKFVVEIDKFLVSRNGLPTNVKVTTEEWNNYGLPFMIIPAAKKMFAKYSEAGLLASLFINGHSKEAQNFYCISYEKGKVKDSQVEFKNINIEDFKRNLLKSANNLREALIIHDTMNVEEILKRFEGFGE